MELILVGATVIFVIWLYFKYNPLHHNTHFMIKRFWTWFPLGMTYAFLYMGRYNLIVSKNALGDMMSNKAFGLIFGAGTLTYGLSFLINGPLVDKIGGKKGILISAVGAAAFNTCMGIATYLFLNHRLKLNMTVTFAVLYSLNMYFQSFGAGSLNKVKSYWFHVRERGIFGAIFGTLISFGVYFAFDWGTVIANAVKAHIEHPTTFQRLIQNVFGTGHGGQDAIWLIFYIPAGILMGWFLLDLVLIHDTPGEAGLQDFDTHDASSGEMEKEFTVGELLIRVLTHPILITVSLVEFTAGVIRNGIMQWYFIFAHQVPQPGAEFFENHWGILLCVSGILGGFSAGYVSDYFFHSRRGPPVVLAGGVICMVLAVMSFILFSSPVGVGSCAILICLFSISIHALMSGTAASDFGGRKAAATASGITDGFVYLGSGLQSVSLGFLITRYSWEVWPLFLLPFTLLTIYFAVRMWKSLPAATEKYLAEVEKVVIAED